MSDYQLTATEEPCSVIRTEDGASIPPDPANRDYAEYMQWKDDGGVPDAYVAPEPVPPMPEDPVQDVVLFDHENRIRAIEGQPPIDLGEFRQSLRR